MERTEKTPSLKERKWIADQLRGRVLLPIFQGVDESFEKIKDRGTLNDIKVSCTPGCAACCYQLVIITSGEALGIARYVVERRSASEIEKLRGELRRQADLMYSMDRDDWFKSSNGCAFLNRGKLPRITQKGKLTTVGPEPEIDSKWWGTCSIYEHRPVSCRVTHAVSPAKNCTPVQEDRTEGVSALDIGDLETRAVDILQNGGHSVLGRKWAAPLPCAVLWCLNWILDGKWPPNNEINKWLRRVMEWRGLVAPTPPPVQADPA